MANWRRGGRGMLDLRRLRYDCPERWAQQSSKWEPDMPIIKNLGIATVLAVVFGGLVIISTGTLLVSSLTNVVQTTRGALTARVEAMLDEAVLLSEAFYEPMEARARWLVEEIRLGRVTPAEDAAFQAVLVGMLAATEQISAVSFQRTDGSGYFYDREDGILRPVTWPAAWRVALNSRTDGPQTWPPADGEWVLRPSVIDTTPEGTFIVPVRGEDGQDTGVVAVRRDAIPLAREFATNAEFRGNEIVRFMLFNDQIVVGHPELATMSDPTWPSIEDLQDPYLKALSQAEREALLLVGEIEGAQNFRIMTDAGERVFVLREVTDITAGGSITLGVHFDPATGAPEYNRIVRQAVFGVALLVGSILVAIWVGQRASVPMQRLADMADLVEQEKLADVTPLPASPVREMAVASEAFNNMVDGLKERKRVRDLFGKYVPANVAALLVADEAASAPRNATATVLFLDIAGFSAISERLTPGEVVNTMNAFFSDAVEYIEDHGGMVAQFQGDALLAVFNLPIERDDHAHAALRAALAILRKVDEETYAGQRLACRIGINTGTVVAGAIGARDRLSYTVYGDTVNVAARLETLNKELGTRILISGTTAEMIEGVTLEPKGDINVRGRQAAVPVFSVGAGDPG